MNDIIFALASAKGRAGVSVIRVSGKNSIFSIELGRYWILFVNPCNIIIDVRQVSIIVGCNLDSGNSNNIVLLNT